MALKDNAEFLRMIYDFFAHGTKRTYAALGVGLIMAILYFRVFFRGASGFKGDVDEAGKLPLVNQDYDRLDTEWSKMKIMVWICFSVGCGALAYYQLPQWLPGVFGK